MAPTALAALTALSLLGGVAAAAEFHARPSEATLQDTERTYPRVSIEKDWYPAHLVGNRRYRVDGNMVTEVTVPGKPKQSRASVPADYRLRWLSAAEGIAVFVADRDAGKFDPDDPESNRRFHRLDLDSMQWLAPFKLPEPSIKPTQQQKRILSQHARKESRTVVLAEHLLVIPNGVLVLSAESVVFCRDNSVPNFLQREVIGYHVSSYGTRDTEAKWNGIIRDGSQAHRSAGWAMSSYNDFIERLTYVSSSFEGGLILVCLGERDALVCLSAADGKVRWRIPAIWEYERGFIGPSVFEHYIERFGLDFMTVQSATSPVLPEDGEIDRKQLRERIQMKIQAQGKLTAARKAFYARYQGRITAGPIVAPQADEQGRDRIYMAATRSLKPEPGGAEQPEHALIYEIDPGRHGAEIIGMTRLPREVIGRPDCKVPGGLVLSCNRGMVRLRTYEPIFGGAMGPGNAADDLVLQVDWYREYPMRSPSAWLTANPPTDVAGFSKARLFRPGRAYILTKQDKVYELTINVVDLRTGLDRDLTLSVPFEGSLPIPETGLSSTNQGTPSEQFDAHDPHVVWIHRLSVNSDRLKVVVAHNSAYTELTFDLAAMLADE